MWLKTPNYSFIPLLSDKLYLTMSCWFVFNFLNRKCGTLVGKVSWEGTFGNTYTSCMFCFGTFSCYIFYDLLEFLCSQKDNRVNKVLPVIPERPCFFSLELVS